MNPRMRIAVLMAMVFLGGCSGNSDHPETVPVTGKVTYQGSPLVGAQVSFMTEGAARAAAGTTDGDGRYQLTTFAENDGAVVGEHTVSITKAPDTSGASAENPDASYDALMGGGPAPAAQTEGQFAPVTNLKATVTADGPNEFNFDL